MDVFEKDIIIYTSKDGSAPFLDWFIGIRDERARQKIQARIGRIRLGGLGIARSVGDGVHELKIDYGVGYRVYFGNVGNKIVILLCGGDKSSQNEDIKKAKVFWKNFKKDSRC